MPDIVFTDAAIDDLRRLGPDVAPKVLKKVQILFENPEAGLPLEGKLTGFRKLVVGRKHWRVVYRIDGSGSIEICEVWCVGARSDAEVYAEATARVTGLADSDPAIARLADVINKLGRLAGDVTVEDFHQSEPVPDWLATRLVHTAGIPAEQVAALDLEQAVSLWEAYLTSPRE